MVYVPATGKSKPVEEEIITEENVYDRPDESMSFFPGQVLKDTYVFTFLLLACTVLSYAAPAPLTAPADTATVEYGPRPGWFLLFYAEVLMFFPGHARAGLAAVV